MKEPAPALALETGRSSRSASTCCGTSAPIRPNVTAGLAATHKPEREAFAAGITNCQIGAFAAYVSRHGHAFVDRALYLPKAWTDDPARLAAAHVPADIGFATKPQLARRMVERAMASGVPFAWVTADTVYRVSELEMALRHAGRGYVLGMPKTQRG